MQIWITFILINIIHQTHVSAAPVDSSFGKIADAIINPAWTLNNPDSPKKDNKDTDLNDKNDENLPTTVDAEIENPNTKNKKKNNSRKKNKRNGKKRNNNKRRRNNTRRNGRYLWYNVFPMDDLVVNLPEYRNYENEQKIVLIWDDKRRIVQNEHVDALSMNNLNNNQLIRQKRDYNNILELQDNILQTRNINQHDLEENENSMSSNSNKNINENMKFLNLRNSNTNKFKKILQNRKQPTNTIIRNKISQQSYAQGLGKTLGADNNEKEGSQLKVNEKNLQKINAITTLSNDKPELIIGENTGLDKNTPEIEKIDTLINGINSNSDEGADDDKDSKSYQSLIETKNGYPNYSDIEDNKQHDIIKNIKHQFKPKSRKLKTNNDKGTLRTRFTPNAPSKNYQKTPSIDKPEHKTERNTDIPKNIPVNDEIDTIINTMNSNSEEDSSSENSDSNTSSLEKQQDILDLSDLGHNKEKNLLKNIKQPLKPISKIQEKTLLENNEKLPEMYEKYLNNPSEINTKNEKGSQQKGNTPTSLSINNQQTPSINVPRNITPEHTDVTKNIPVNNEIESLMNAINSNSEEGTDDQNSEPNTSSLETKQEIPNYSDVEDNKQHNILKNIKHSLKPKSRKLGKIQPKNNDKGTLQTRFTINAPSQNNPKTPSTDKPEHKTERNTDIPKNIPENDEIDTLINTMNSNSEEDSSSENSDSNTSSLEKQQNIPDLSDLRDNKEMNLLKNIKQPLKPISKIQEKTLLENNEKLPKMYEKYLNNPSETNIKNEKGSQQKGNTQPSLSINNQQTPSINIQRNITPEHTDVTKNIPVNNEIESLMNAINSNSEEGTDDQNSEPNTSSLETKQEIPKYSDVEDNKQHNILKNIKHSLKPKSRKLGKIQPKNNDKGTLQTRFTINAPSQNNPKTPSTDKPEHKTERNTDIPKNIPVNDEIDTLINTMNSNSEENSSSEHLDSNTSSLEQQQDILDLSDLGDKKEKNFLKNIKQPLKPISKIRGKTLLENNKKLPEIYKPKFDNAIEINKNNKEGPQQETLTPITHDNMLGDSLHFDEVDLSQPVKNKKKVIPASKTDDFIKNEEDDKLKNIPINNDNNSNIIQINKSIKTPELIDTTIPKSNEKVIALSTETPLNDFDVSDPLGEYNKLGGFTMEDGALEKLKDESPSAILDNNNNKDHNDSLQVTNQPTLMKPNTNIDKIPKNLSDSKGQKKLVDKFGSNSYDDLFGDSLDIDEIDLSQPVKNQKKVIPVSETDDIITNVEDDKLKPIYANNDNNSNIIQINKSIKTPELIDTTLPKSSEKVIALSTETPLNDFDVSDPLGEYNKLGGFTMEDGALEKLKDESPSATLDNNNNKDHDDSLQVTNQPTLMKPNTENPNTMLNESVDTNIDKIPKNLSDGKGQKKLIDKFGSNSYDDLFGDSLDIDEVDLSQPVKNKKKVIPVSKTDDIIKNVEDDKIKPIPTNNDNNSNMIQKNKSMKTPELNDTTILKSTEKVIALSTETPLNDFDVSDPLGEYKKLGGFTMEDGALEKLKKESPSTILDILDNDNKKDHDDSLQVTNQPTLMKPNTNIDKIPKNLSDSKAQKKLVDKFGSNSYDDLFGDSLDIDEIDLSQPVKNQKKVIPVSKTDDIIKNVEDDKIKPIPTNNDNNSNMIQKNKSMKTPELNDTTILKSTEKVIALSTETPLNDFDVSDPLGEYKKLGGFTMEDGALEKLKKESPSAILDILDNDNKKDHDDSLQVTNQPTLMKPNTNIDKIPKNLSDSKAQKKLVDKFGSNSYDDLFGDSLDIDEIDLSQPVKNQKKVIPVSKTDDIIKNVEDDKLKPIPTNNDDNSNIIQKKKSMKTPELIDTTVPKSNEKVIALSTETPLNEFDVADPLGEYNKLGGFTMEDGALEKLKDESPSATLDNNNNKDHDDSLQVTNQPTLMKPNTENPNTMLNESVDTNIDKIPKNLSDGKGQKKLIDKFGSNSYDDLFGDSLDIDEVDLSQPVKNKKKVIPVSKTDDIIKNVEDDKIKPIPTNNDNNSNMIQKNKSMKTPELNDTTILKSTEKVIALSTETPLNDFDVSDPLGEYKKLGGFTMEDGALEKLKKESPSTILDILDNDNKKDHDDSLQVTNQPTLMKPNTNIDKIPKNLSDSKAQKKLVDKFGSNSYDDLFGDSLDIDEIDLSQPVKNQKKVIPVSKTDDIIKNVEDDKIKPIPTNNDNNSNMIQKNKSMKTPELNDTTILKSTEKVIALSTETPLNDFDVSDPLGEYKKLGGFTMEDGALEKLKKESPSAILDILDNDNKKDHDDSLQVTNQPTLMKPNTNIDKIPKNLSDSKAQKKLVDKFGSNSYDDLFGDSLDIDEIDLSQPVKNQKKVIPVSKTDDIIKNVEDDKLKPIPTNNDDNSNIIQKKKSMKTPELIDTTVPKSNEKVIALSTETPLNEFDVADPLGEYNKLGGFTMEDGALEKLKDESPSATLDNNNNKDHDDSLQVTNQPTLMKPNTENPNTMLNESVDTNIDKIPKNLSDGKGQKKLIDKFGSNSYDDLFGDSLDIDEVDLSQPVKNKKKVIPVSKTDDIIKNVEDDKIKPIPTNNDNNSNMIQKNKSMKTPELNDTTILKSTEKVIALSTETPLNDFDVSDPLGEYKKLGGFTMEDGALEKLKKESPSTILDILDNDNKKDHDDSLQVTNQPTLMKPNTNIDKIPKNLSDSKAQKKLVDKFGSNSYDDLFGDSLDIDEIDLSQPVKNQKKVIPVSKTDDIIKNVEDDKIKPIPTNNDNNSNMIQKNKSMKTPELNDTTILKSTEKVIALSTETPLNDFDVSDPLGEYKKLGGFTMEDGALEKLKKESPSAILDILDNDNKKDHDDSLQVTNQPTLMKPNTNIDKIPKNLSDSKAQKKLVDKFGSNSYDDLFGDSLDIDEIDLSQPVKNQKKVIPVSKTDDIIKNVEDDKLKPIPTNNDDNSNIIQKKKSMKTPELIDTTVPKSNEKVIAQSTETPLNDFDVSDPLGEYNKLGGFTMEDGALEKLKDESPSATLDNNNNKDHDDSLQVTNQPTLMKPNTENPNAMLNESVDSNIDKIPKNLSDGKGQKKLIDKFGSNSYDDLFGDSLDIDEVDLSQPVKNKKKVIPVSKTDDIIKNVEDDKIKPIPTNNDNNSNMIQKNKSMKTPELNDTTILKSTEKVIALSTETPLNDFDVSDPLGEYKKLGGFTMEDGALEKLKKESPSTILDILDNDNKKDHDDSLQVTNQPTLMKPNTNIDKIPKNLSDSKAQKKLVDKFGSNSYDDLFGDSLDIDEIDLSQPVKNQKKVIPVSKTDDIIKNVEDDKIKPIPTNNDNNSNMIQKNKSIKTPELIDTTVPKSNEKVIALSTETPSNEFDVADPLGEYSKLGGFTMEDGALEKLKDESPSATLDNNNSKDHDDSLQVTNQPTLMKPNTENPNTMLNESVDTKIDKIPKNLSDGKGQKKLIDKFGSNSYDDLFGDSLDIDEIDLSQPVKNKKKVIPVSETDDIIKNVEDDKLKPIPTNNDDNSNIIQKNKSIKTPELIDTTDPKSNEKVITLSTETPLNDIDVSDPLGEYNKLGGFTMEDGALEKLKDESPSAILDNNNNKDHDDSLQVTNQPTLIKPNTVNPNTKFNENVETNIDSIPKNLSEGNGKKKLVDKFGANSYDDMLGDSLDFDKVDLSDPVKNKKKVIAASKTDDFIKNVEDDKLKPIPTNNDNNSNIIQINKSIKTPELIDTTVPKSNENVIALSTETPLNDFDVSDPLGEYNKLGGFTMEDGALEKLKDESPSAILDNNNNKDHDDSLQVTNQPTLIKPNTVNLNTKFNENVETNIDSIPKNLSEGKGKKKLVDKFSSNSYDDMLGDSLDFDKVDLSDPVKNKKKVIAASKTDDFIKNVEDDKLKPIPTNNDNNSNIIQINKSIKTPELIDTTVPKSNEKVIALSTETPLNDFDVSDPLGEYNKLGGFTMDDGALEKLKDESPSATLDNNNNKDHDDSLQVTNQPMLMKPNTENPNTMLNESVDTNIDKIPKNLSDGKGQKKLIDKFGSNSYDDMLGDSLDFDKVDLSDPVKNKKKVIAASKTDDFIKNVEDDKLKPIPTNNDDNSNIIQKKKSMKTPELIDTTVPKSNEKVIALSTETPLNEFDVAVPLGEYTKLGGFTMVDGALEKLKDEAPSAILDILDNDNNKDHDDSLQVTNQPTLMKPNTVNPNTMLNESVDTNIDKIPKNLSDGNSQKKLIDKFGSNSYDDLFGDSLEIDEIDLSQPVKNKKKVIPVSETDDIIKNVEDDKLKPIPTNNDDNSNIIQKNKSMKTPELIDTTVPKSNEKVIALSTETPLNEFDVADPLVEYSKLGGFTMEDGALEKLKDESPSAILDNNNNKGHDDSLQVTNQPTLIKPNTVNPNTKFNENVETNIDSIPKNLSEGKGKKKLVDKFGSNSYDDMLGDSLDFDEVDLSQPVKNKKKVIPVSKTDDIIKNVKDDKVKPIPTNNDLFKTYTPSTTTNIEEIPMNLSGNLEKIMLDDKINSNPIDNFLGSSIGFNKLNLPQPGYDDIDNDVITKSGNILSNIDDVTLKSTLTDDNITPNTLQKNKLIKKLNHISNADSKIFDLIEPTTQTNYDLLKNDNKIPLSKIPSNVIDKHSSNSNTIHNYNNNLLNNDKDASFNRRFITNPFVEYNSKDLSSLEDGDRYGYMLPKFSTKYSEGDESNYNLWESIPPKKNNDVSSDKGYNNLIYDLNQSAGLTTKNNKISSHTLNENNIVTGAESVKNNYNNDKVNTDIFNKQYDDFIKKMSEQLFKKIDNIDDKLAKLDKVSHNCSYVREISNIGSHEPSMNNVLLTNDIPITKPEKVINIEDSYSKTNKPIESLGINTSNKSDDENKINKNESPNAKKHKIKKHKRESNKKKDEKNNKSNDDDDDDDDDYDYDDDYNDDGIHKNNKHHKHKDKHNNDDGKYKKNKRHKNKDINKDDDDKHKKNKRHKNKDLNKDDDGKHKKNKDINNDDSGKHKNNKRHKNNDLNDNDNGKHKKNKRHKKNKKIDNDNSNGGHRKKSHKKKYSKVDDDVVSKHKKHKSHKKKNRNYNDVEILQSKKSDNKKQKKIKENVYSPEESNDVNHSSSIQINSENNDTVKRSKTTSSKSKISKKTNSTKTKKSSPKKKSKYVKHSKTVKYKNKEIPVNVSDEDTSSNENNYNSEKTYIKYISNNNQNNVQKNKKNNKHSKTSKTYIYKKIPEDKNSDENSVNLEETYNINIISDDDALRQKKHRHKKNKKKKKFDINIVKDTDTDTDTQVLNNDKKTQNGFQFYTFYPQYRYATLNPFSRLLTNSYL